MQHVDLSIIVVSYNTVALLRQCLASLKAGRDVAIEVIVVDNASVDGSAEMVVKEFPWVKVIANETNKGFAAANNQALQEARGRHLLILNPDTSVLGDALDKMVAFMDARPEVGVAGARLLNPDGPPQHSCFHFPTLLMSFFDFFPINYRLVNSRLNGRYPWKAYEKAFPIDHPLGACLLVRREAMEQVGMMDEDFFIYCEEIDWCMRIKRAGWEIYYIPDAAVIHYGAQSTSQFRGTMLIELYRSRYRLFRKHYSRPYRWVARLIIKLGASWEMMTIQRRSRRQQLGELEVQERLSAYREIVRM